MSSRSNLLRNITAFTAVTACILHAATAFAQSAPGPNRASGDATGWLSASHDPQHSGVSSVASQPLHRIRWSTPVDLQPPVGDILIHYGSPLVTAENTVIIPVKTGADSFRIEARKGKNGALLWKMATDYSLPPNPGFMLSLSPVISKNRVIIPGAGGSVIVRDNPDDKKGATKRLFFYGVDNYNAFPGLFQANLKINTPITADAQGNLFFGFQVLGQLTIPLQSGIARIAADGTGSWVSASAISQDPIAAFIPFKAMNASAPALSADGKILYVAINFFDFNAGNLVALDSTTLQPIRSVRLKDPQSGFDAAMSDSSSASPTVGPDGDVYFGVLENPFPAHNDRGWLLHFNRDLSQQKIAGSFGWDNTASIVDASLVPSYKGTSKYLLMTKYNNYAGTGSGDGVNKIAILDPNVAMADPVLGNAVMNEVLTIVAPTPDPNFPGFPGAVREWCINTAAVDPFTKSVIANSEDGKLYRWDLTTNTFSEVITLTGGIGEAYTPTVIGSDGTVYAINNAVLFAIGK